MKNSLLCKDRKLLYIPVYEDESVSRQVLKRVDFGPEYSVYRIMHEFVPETRIYRTFLGLKTNASEVARSLYLTMIERTVVLPEATQLCVGYTLHPKNLKKDVMGYVIPVNILSISPKQKKFETRSA